MSSVFVESPIEVTGFLGQKISSPVYFQFVPGKVVEVCTNKKSLRSYNNENNVGSIIAKPHIYDTLPPRNSQLGEAYRYWPLLRGFSDIPAKGDPVLLCTFGGKRYYLGPLNTDNQVNWNEDNLHKDELVLDKTTETQILPEEYVKGESRNFDKLNFARLTKPFNVQLDNNDGYNGRTINEGHGDFTLEGRHGNSIRIGSRNINPYIFISNGRAVAASREGLKDGSLISITQFGTLDEHFGKFNSPYRAFTFASDVAPTAWRRMIDLYKTTNNTEHAESDIYDYSGNQILISSERLIFNSRRDDLYLSSIKDIYLGAGRSVNITSNENVVIESAGCYLGNPIKNNETREMEPMVLGNILLEIMNELLAALKGAQGICQGAPIPLADDTGGPGTLMSKIVPIEQKLATMLSSYHYIEPNGEKPEETS